MSAALKGVSSICRSCLRRLPPPRALPVVRARLLHTTRKLHSEQTTTARTPMDEIVNALPALSSVSAGLQPDIARETTKTEPEPSQKLRLTPLDILQLKGHLDARDLTAAYQGFLGIASLPNSPEGSETNVRQYLPEESLQPILEELLDGIIADDGRNQDLPKPLEFLKQMGDVGALQTTHYTTLLIAMLKNGTNTTEILPAFNSAIEFNIDRLHEVMAEPDEFLSLDLDVATPYFITYLLLRAKDLTSESMEKFGAHLFRSKYPGFRHVERVLDHHNFSIDMTSYILSLIRAFSIDTLFTNRHTLRQAIAATLAASATQVALNDLYTTLKSKCPPGSPLPTHIYTTLITAFLSLPNTPRSTPRESQQAAFNIWNDMISAGINPTVIEWTELIKSFSSQQDKTVIAPLWKHMLKSGIIPDNHCWTVYIHAQLEANDIAGGLESLRRMNDTGVTPTSATINAVLDGLLKYNHHTEAAQILAVSTHIGIQKDITTYNILLTSFMKQQKQNAGKFEESLALIRQMSAEGIIPDVRTITLILDGMYKYSSPKPTLSSVLSLLSYCESAGIRLNIWTYTALIRALLEQRQEDAAVAIMMAMEAKGMVGNTATYTVLLKYYFMQKDLRSIDSILMEMSQKRVTVDARMWREIAWGFAGLGQVERMKESLEEMWASTTRLALGGYMSVLKALGKKGLLGDAKELVEWMLEKGVVGRSVEARMVGAEMDFWDVVRGLGDGIVLDALMKTGRIEE